MSSSWHFTKPLSASLYLFLSKSETTQNTPGADDFWFSTSFHFFCQLLNLRLAVDIFVSTSFFELSNFEQLIISLSYLWLLLIWKQIAWGKSWQHHRHWNSIQSETKDSNQNKNENKKKNKKKNNEPKFVKFR